MLSFPHLFLENATKSLRSLGLGLLMLLSGPVFTQITLENASFEGQAQDATVPTGWHSCKRGTTPDILPGFWGVNKEASEGETYIGLITRDDGSWESIGQRLQSPLNANECYSLKLDLARSDSYAGYLLPLKLVIWGGTSRCERTQLLAETITIKHTDWRTYNLTLYPEKPINYIIIEAQYMDGIFFHYKGNILLDALSPIKACERAFLGMINRAE